MGSQGSNVARCDGALSAAEEAWEFLVAWEALGEEAAALLVERGILQALIQGRSGPVGARDEIQRLQAEACVSRSRWQAIGDGPDRHRLVRATRQGALYQVEFAEDVEVCDRAGVLRDVLADPQLRQRCPFGVEPIDQWRGRRHLLIAG